jgi:hypothetical protein
MPSDLAAWPDYLFPLQRAYSTCLYWSIYGLPFFILVFLTGQKPFVFYASDIEVKHSNFPSVRRHQNSRFFSSVLMWVDISLTYMGLYLYFSSIRRFIFIFYLCTLIYDDTANLNIAYFVDRQFIIPLSLFQILHQFIPILKLPASILSIL